MPYPVHAPPLPLVFLVMLLAGVVRAAEAPPPATTANPPLVRWRDLAPPPDRLQHASLSFVLAAGVGIAARSPVAGAGVALAAGTGKELADRRHGRFDPWDLAADALGATLGAWAAAAVER